MGERGNFSSKIGFVLAAAGSAVGLGNIWRFPYLAANYGGMFLVTYLILVVTFGFTIMMTEIAVGRKTGSSPIGAFAQLSKNTKGNFSFIGWIAVIVVFIIYPYYSVIGGWVSKYLLVFIMGTNPAVEASGDFFNNYVAQPLEPVLWLVGFILVTSFVVARGVKKGIEAASKILMPVLVVLTIAVAIYSMCLPGAIDGIKYYLVPDFSKMSVNMVLAAMGQMFYSMSLAMGIMITYGSYLRKEDDLEKSVSQIELFDTGIAVMAGFMVIPAVFAFSNGDLSQLNQGPGLMFVTLPQVFASMPFGRLVGALFFLLVLFAALTSSISIMEALVATVCDQFKMKRLPACIVIGGLAIVIGIAPSLGFGIWADVKVIGMGILDFMDFITNSVLMPIGALLTCLFISYVVGIHIVEDEIELSSRFRRKKMYRVIVKYIAPVFILAILISSVLSAFRIITL